MKRIYKITEGFILKHARLQIVISIVMMVVTGMMIIGLYFPIPAAISFGGFLVSAVRLFTFKNGNISIFARDRTWRYIKRKSPDSESADENFRAISAKVATVSYIVGWIAFVVAIVLEILLTVVD